MTGARFDRAATTPMLPEAVEAMVPYLADQAANPSSAHAGGRRARRAIDDARDELADVLGVAPSAIVFTSGGTEADNLAILGAHRPGSRVVVTSIEHPAVREPARALGASELAVDGRGVVDLGRAESAIGDDVGLVSVMTVNNEIGTVQPIESLVALVRDRAPGAVVHTDAVQALPWLDVRPIAAAADLLSISGHKFGGPKGIGALVVSPRAEVAARQLGGGQERGLRSGTPFVAGIVAMATAARLADERRVEQVERVGKLRDRLVDGLTASIDGIRETAVVDGDRSHKVAGNAHLSIDGVEGEALLFLLDEAGIEASAASACSSGAAEPSHVLSAIGAARDHEIAALRLSLGADSTDAEVDHALAVIPDVVARLRRTGS